MHYANLVYASRSVAKMSPKMVSELAEQAARRNGALDITGLLVCGGGRFLQVLEGHRGDITQLFAKIAADPRHTDCQILLEQTSTHRRFPAWHMGHLSVGQASVDDQEQWDTLCREIGRSLDPQSLGSDPVLALVREFIERFGHASRQRAYSA